MKEAGVSADEMNDYANYLLEEDRASLGAFRHKTHYHFRVRFCNPYSGWEKGNVERKVDYNRANLFVPVPRFTEIEKYNRKLLLGHEKKVTELHYKKQVPIGVLFEEDRKVLVGIRAHTIDILTEGGQVVTTHRRAFGEGRSDISDYSTTLAVLMKNSGAWENSGLRRETPDALRAYMDAQPGEKLEDSLRIMNELTNQYGFQAAFPGNIRDEEDGNGEYLFPAEPVYSL